MLLTKVIRRLYLAYLIKRNPVKYARHIGVQVGEGTRLMGVRHGTFSTEPFLITIGCDCLLTGVQFITHDGSVYHLKKKYPRADLFGKIEIGNNVFVGLGTIILPGVSVGDNVVIGAGAVVSRSIPSNAVAVGVPAKVISTLDSYLEKIEEKIVHTGGLPMSEKRRILENELQ